MAYTKPPLSFFEWEQQCLLEQQKEPEIVIESIEEEAVAVEIPQPESDEDEDCDSEKNEAFEKIRNLCRVCLSSGFISISSTLTPKLLKLKPSGDMRPWQLPIYQIIEEVSGESVS
jgi:hypothetical protein